MTVVEVLASALILAGVLFNFLGALGLQRFPDVFSRMHAATKSVTLGMGLVLAGVALLVPDRSDSAKLLLVAGLQFVTAPVSAHMIGRAAYRAGTELSPDTRIDELAGPGMPPSSSTDQQTGLDG